MTLTPVERRILINQCHILNAIGGRRTCTQAM